jgi:hypothetical protein
MKKHSIPAIILALFCGTGVGIGLQKYANISDRTGNLLSQVGLGYLFPSSNAQVVEAIAQPAVPVALQGKLKLYVLVGQSNMVGNAAVPKNFKTSANIFTFGNDYRWQVGQEPVDDATGQVDIVSEDLKAGFGPAFTFAKTLVLQDSNQLIGLIPCAKDGSSITDWQQNISDQSLYGSCIKRVRAASAMGTVSGILFFQGEADTIDPRLFPALQPDAEGWAEKFALFAYNFRQDLGNPNLPLVYAQLGQPSDLEGLPNWALVQDQQKNIQIPNGTLIETNDLPMAGIHFTTESYQVIGQRFADAMVALAASSNPKGESLPAESAQIDLVPAAPSESPAEPTPDATNEAEAVESEPTGITEAL